VKSPLLLLACSFALGIFLAHPERLLLSDLIRDITVLLTAGGFCLLIGLICLGRKWWLPSSVLALAGFAIAGAATAFLFEARFPPNHVRNLKSSGIDLSDPVRVEGVLVSSPLRTADALKFEMDARSIEAGSFETGPHTRPLRGNIQIRLEASRDLAAWPDIEAMRLQYGDRIRAMIQLRRPHIYQNPGGFDFRLWMESVEDLFWVGTIKSPLLVEKLPRTERPGLSDFLVRTRQRLVNSIDTLYPPWSGEMRDGAVLKAVLLGERASLDSDTIENFRKTGLYHLLVIAGLHIGLLALIAGYALRLLPLGEAWRTTLLVIFLLAYAAVVEERAPTLRATLMILVYLTARLFYREHAALNAIGLAALGLLLYRPAWLFETGFQLSFSAALLIAGLAVPILARTTEPYRRALWKIDEIGRDQSLEPRQAQFRLDLRDLIEGMKSRLSIMQRHPATASFTVTGPIRAVVWAANMLLFSAVLQVGLSLPMAQTFHRVTIAGIGLNALAIPVMVCLLASAVPMVILGAIAPALAVWPAKAVHLILSLLFALTDWPGLSGWLSFRVSSPPVWVAWGFVLSAVIAAWALGRKAHVFQIALASLAFFAALVALHPFAPRLPHGVLEVTALDCGGGDALFVVLPDRTTLLMGAGGIRMRNNREGALHARRWDPGEDIVSPYLWSRGVERIDIVVLSDSREEHLAGMAAVIGNFSVGEFWHGKNPATPGYLDLLEKAKRLGIAIREVAAGDRFVSGETAVQILWPHAGREGIFASHTPNQDDSLVMRISAGEAGILLPGDITAKVEEELLRSEFPLESRTLRLTQHDSKTSSASDFLARVLPSVALVSSESGGRTAMPSAEFLERLRLAGIQAFRPDIDGAVTVEMRGRSVSVRTYRASPSDF
jgi:competence protein ComEC